jgi:hypothetical protein
MDHVSFCPHRTNVTYVNSNWTPIQTAEYGEPVFFTGVPLTDDELSESEPVEEKEEGKLGILSTFSPHEIVLRLPFLKTLEIEGCFLFFGKANDIQKNLRHNPRRPMKHQRRIVKTLPRMTRHHRKKRVLVRHRH